MSHVEALRPAFDRLAADKHDLAAHAALALYPRWVLRTVKKRAEAHVARTPTIPPGGLSLATVAERTRAFRNVRWAELHAALLASAADFRPRPSCAMLRRQERATLVGMGAPSNAGQCLINASPAVQDAAEAVAVLTPLHGPAGALLQEEDVPSALYSPPPSPSRSPPKTWSGRCARRRRGLRRG